MANIHNTVENYLVSQGFKYTKLDGNKGFTLNMSANVFSNMRIHILVRERSFVCYAVAPINAPENKRMAIAEFIARANYGMPLVTFELDFSDGEIRTRSSLQCADQTPPMKAVEAVVDSVSIILDKYASGINSVLFANVAPQAAIASIEEAAN